MASGTKSGRADPGPGELETLCSGTRTADKGLCDVRESILNVPESTDQELGGKTIDELQATIEALQQQIIQRQANVAVRTSRCRINTDNHFESPPCGTALIVQ